MDRLSSDTFLSSFEGDNWDIVDFKKFSMADNLDLTQYQLNFQAILDALRFPKKNDANTDTGVP